MTDWIGVDMSDVIWMDHPVHTKYSVSSDGRVRGCYGREMKPYLHHDYFQTTVRTDDGGTKCVRFHRLVCETFHGEPPTPEHQVRHLNGIKTDNRAENLAWGTASENGQDTVRHGDHYWAKRTHCKAGHLFDEQNTYFRKTGRAAGTRMCQECMRQSQRRRSQRRVA